MCGRFFVPGDDEELSVFIREANRKSGADVCTVGEVAPGQPAAVIAQSRNRTHSSFLMHWGYRLQRRLVFNARSETADSVPMFRDGFLHRRCLIPAGCYYEWDHREKKPPRCQFYLPERSLMYLAGLYRLEQDGLYRFAILTRDASPDFAALHPRMPVLFRKGDAQKWLDPNGNPADMLSRSVSELVWSRG